MISVMKLKATAEICERDEVDCDKSHYTAKVVRRLRTRTTRLSTCFFRSFSPILPVACQKLIGRLVTFDVGAVTPSVELLDAFIVRIQLLVDETVRVGADYAPHRRIVHDC